MFSEQEAKEIVLRSKLSGQLRVERVGDNCYEMKLPNRMPQVKFPHLSSGQSANEFFVFECCIVVSNFTRDHKRGHGRSGTSGGTQEQGLCSGLQVRTCENLV